LPFPPFGNGNFFTVDILSTNEELADGLKSKAFRAKIESSKSNKLAIVPFLAAVNIDLKRRIPIGLLDLFNVWLELGNKYWLNPMDKESGLGVLEEILFKFQGDAQVLSPFITLLIRLAQDGISPRSFIEYVILPRMYQDYNWRKWQENHMEALRIIAGLINSIKNRTPFNQEHLGSGKTRLARDVVLVRYIGRPLAQFQLPHLRDSAMLENYIGAWQKISLQDPLSLYFMRNNALHFIYVMSGKIDLVQFYKWHTKKLLAKAKNDMGSYLEFIEECNGCDPEYPQIDRIFRDEEQARENLEIADIIADFGLEHHFAGGVDNVSYNQLLGAYTQVPTFYVHRELRNESQEIQRF